MTRFGDFVNIGGLRGCAFHLMVGIVATVLTTSLGIAADRSQAFAGYAARVLLWPSYLLWHLVRSNFVERYEDGLPIYAGIPFMFTWFLGILLATPLYAFVSALIAYFSFKRVDP